jgi:hypothetical protein
VARARCGSGWDGGDEAAGTGGAGEKEDSTGRRVVGGLAKNEPT